MGVIEKVKTVVLALGGLPEIASQVYYDFDKGACVEHYRDLAGVPFPLPFIAPKHCHLHHQVMVSFDCHGHPVRGNKDYPWGDLLEKFFPSVAWAKGKYEIHHTGVSYKPALTPVWITHAWDLRKGCCPPDWTNEILGEEGTPD